MSGDPFLAALFAFFITGFRSHLVGMKPSSFDKLGIGDSKKHRIKRSFGDREMFTGWWFQTFLIFTPSPGEMI